MINGDIDLTENKDFKRDTEEKIKNLHANEIIPWSKKSGKIVSNREYTSTESYSGWFTDSFPQIYRIYYSDTDIYDEASIYQDNMDSLYYLNNYRSSTSNLPPSYFSSNNSLAVYYDNIGKQTYTFNYSSFKDNSKKKESVFPVKERYNKMVSINYLKREKHSSNCNEEIYNGSMWIHLNHQIPWKSREPKMLDIGGFDVKPEKKKRRSYKNNNSPIPWLNNLVYYVYNDYMEELRNDKEKDYSGYLTSNWFHAKG